MKYNLLKIGRNGVEIYATYTDKKQAETGKKVKFNNRSKPARRGGFFVVICSTSGHPQPDHFGSP